MPPTRTRSPRSPESTMLCVARASSPTGRSARRVMRSAPSVAEMSPHARMTSEASRARRQRPAAGSAAARTCTTSQPSSSGAASGHAEMGARGSSGGGVVTEDNLERAPLGHGGGRDVPPFGRARVREMCGPFVAEGGRDPIRRGVGRRAVQLDVPFVAQPDGDARPRPAVAREHRAERVRSAGFERASIAVERVLGRPLRVAVGPSPKRDRHDRGERDIRHQRHRRVPEREARSERPPGPRSGAFRPAIRRGGHSRRRGSSE